MKLTPQQREKLAWIIVALVTLIVSVTLGITYPLPPTARAPQGEPIVELGTTHFSGLNVFGPVDLDETLNVDGASTFVGAVGFTGAITADNDLTVDDTFNLDDTDSALTGSQTITPTTTFYEFAPLTTLTITLATGEATVGDLLILQNTVSTSTVIIDTTATQGGGNITLGANDLALFIFSNSVWVEIASPDNS